MGSKAVNVYQSSLRSIPKELKV